MVEGANVLEAALDGGADIEALFAAPEAETQCPALLDRATGRGILVHRLAPGVLERVAGTVTPQPVLAVARRRPPALADIVGSGGGRGADPLLLVGLQALLARFLGLRRPPLDQPHGQEDVEQELQVLGLPVLGDVGPETRRRQVTQEADAWQPLGYLLLVVHRSRGGSTE